VCPLVHSVRAALEQRQNIEKKKLYAMFRNIQTFGDASDLQFSPTVKFASAALDYASRQTAVG
jgi:hypothetical protein